MNKLYTSIEQSKVLAKILPLESADMWWAWYSNPLSNGHYDDYPMFYKPICNPDESVPCWSLAALLDVLPKIVNNETLFIETSAALWHIGYRNIYTARADNPIDACYEMIIKLHELNLL